MHPILFPQSNLHPVADKTAATSQLKRPARRIVCLTATGFDLLAELGLTPVGGSASEVAEQPELYGAEAQAWPRVGSYQ